MLYPTLNELIALKNDKKRKVSLSPLPVTALTSGMHQSPFQGHGLEFDSVREYVAGDDIRRIDWRVTARIGAPHLKLFTEERERHRVIIVDMNTSMRFGTKRTFKSVQAARVAALLGWRGLEQHDTVSGCLFGDVPNEILLFPPRRTHKSFCMMLKAFTEGPTDHHIDHPVVSMHTALEKINRSKHPGSLVYLISDFMELRNAAEYEPVLSSLKKKCELIFISINDRADKSISPLGMVKFSSSIKDQLNINTDLLAGRKAYTRLFEENRETLRNLSAKFKIPLLELTTESDLTELRRMR